MMIYREDNRFCIETQELFGSFADTPSNRKVVIAFLRCLRTKAGRPLFTLQELAKIVESENRQAASEHAEQFRACGEDFEQFLKRQRKVDEEIVEAVFFELKDDPLSEIGVLRDRVHLRLGRCDLSEMNIRAALDQISFSRMRSILTRQFAKGQAGIAYREEALIEALLEQVAENRVGQKAGLGLSHKGQDRPLCDPTAIRKLLEPGACLEEITGCVQWVCFCMTLYFWGIPLSRLGLWMGVDKSTIFRWIGGLVNEIYAPITEHIQKHVRPSIVYVDEKWLQIRGVWYYWFVAFDHATQIPILSYLSQTRSAWTCQFIGLALKQLKGHITAIVTDGLASYVHLLPGVRHLLCHFHHQQGVTTWLKAHLDHKDQHPVLKKEMKRLLQTNDKRTVKRRLAKLSEKAQAWGITAWVEKTKTHLYALLPAIGSRVLPTTTNAIERFFRNFNRFYKVRRGFHSVASAKDQLAIFLIGYLFSKRAQDGHAPIEAIWKEAAQTPLYRLINDPFGLAKCPENVKRFPKMADILPIDLLVA